MDELRKLTIPDLQSLLVRKGLEISYRKKEDLVKRLYEHTSQSLVSEESSPSAGVVEEETEKNYTESLIENIVGVPPKRLQGRLDSEELENSEDGTEEEDSTVELNLDSGSVRDNRSVSQSGRVKEKKMAEMNHSFSFRDIEESLEHFNGERGKSVTIWLKEYEDVAEMCNWNEVQKYLYARRLLKGAARLAIEADTSVKSWDKLRSALIRDFSTSSSSIELHRCLENRKKVASETYLEYVYSMKRLASRGSIDEESIVAYIIAGIPDDPTNKMILYDAKTIADLKMKLKAYESMKKQRTSKAHEKNLSNLGGPRKPSRKRENSRCTICGAYSHNTAGCPNKSKGIRCFNCNEFGNHISARCPLKSGFSMKKFGQTQGEEGQSGTPYPKQVNSISVLDSTLQIIINDSEYTALIDTGSDVTLIRKSVYTSRPTPWVNEGPSIALKGFGRNVSRTMCSIPLDLKIGNDVYQIQSHVVPNEWLSQDVLIGKDLLRRVTLFMENGKPVIKRNQISEAETDDEDFLQQMDVFELGKEEEYPSIDNIQDKELRSEVKHLMDSYVPERPPKSCVEMHITLENEVPVYQKPRRLAPKEKAIVSEQVQQWLREGIVVPSPSNFASPVVLARKSDGSYRLCVDYRKLNKKIVKDRYPLPLIEEILENLHSAKIFTTLDLKNGFFHVDINEKSRKYTSFIISDGQYEFLKVPFGLCNSPAVFQRFVNTVFQPLIRKNILLVYIDDIIIPSADEKENLDKLKLVLETARRNGLVFKWKKCKFLRRQVEFLGHVIENGSMKPSLEKTKAVVGFPIPKSVKDVRSFLGLTGFFRRFVENYSIIAKPLTDLIRKDTNFNFGPNELNAFNELKRRLSTEPVLKLFKPGRETELHTDASKAGLGAILLQRQDNGRLHPVFFLSSKTTKCEERYSSYELEVLAIIKAVSKLRSYLLGEKFKIYTDCKAFQYTMTKRELCSRVARWALLLEEYQCSVHHRSGSAMRHVDALSRYPVVLTLEEGLLHRIRKAQKEDENCSLILEMLKRGQFGDYIIRNDTLYKFESGNYLLVLPKAMQKDVIKSVHEKGHICARKTEAAVKQDYYVPKLAKNVEKIIVNCVPCILASKKEGKQEGILNPIEKLDVPLHTYHIDHLGPLTSTAKNYKYLLVVIDSFTKFCWLYPVKDTTSAEVLRHLEKQGETFGNPWRIVTDRGTAFTSSTFKTYCDEQKINHITVTTGVPRGNGQVERLNRVIISALAKMSVEQPEKWYKHVSKLQRFLNSTQSRATSKTPFELLFGTTMRNPEDFELSRSLEDAIIEEFDEQRSNMRNSAKEAIARIQEENRKYSLRRRKKARVYRVHDLVAVKKAQFTPGAKLFPKFMGPYEVIKIKGKDRYELRKVGDHEGPNTTTSAADHMKPWTAEEDSSSSGPDE